MSQNVGSIQSEWTINLDALNDLKKGLTEGGKSTESWLGKASQLGNVFTGFKSAVDLFRDLGGMIKGAAEGFVELIQPGIEFDKTMSAVKANLPTEELDKFGEKLKDLALQLGKETSFSAGEAAAGMEEFVKAGVSASDILGGGLKAGLDLAAAGGLDLKNAAEIAANALNQFKLNGSEAGRVADLLAGAANVTTADVSGLGEALTQSGSAFAMMKIPVEDAVTAIAAMAQAGIQGSDAGTSLKTMLLRLNPTTKEAKAAMAELGVQIFNADGTMKPLRDIIAQLSTAFAGLTDEQKLAYQQTIFGQDAIRASTALTALGAAGWDKLKTSVGEFSAAEVARQKLDNLAGDLEQFRGSTETLWVHLTDALNPTLRMLAQFAKYVADAVLEWVEANKQWIGQAVWEKGAAFVIFVQQLFPIVVSVVAAIWDWVKSAIELGKWLGEWMRYIYDFMAAPLTGYLSAIISNIGTLVGWLIQAAGKMGEWLGTATSQNALGFQSWFQAMLRWVLGLTSAVGELAYKVIEWYRANKELVDEKVTNFFSAIMNAVSFVAATMNFIVAAIFEWIAANAGLIGGGLTSFLSLLVAGIGKLADWIFAAIDAVGMWINSQGGLEVIVGRVMEKVAWFAGIIMNTVIPAIGAIIGWIVQWVAANKEWIGNSITATLEFLVFALGKVYEAILYVIDRIQYSAELLGGWGAIWEWIVKTVKHAADNITFAIREIIIPILKFLWDTLVSTVNTIKTFIGDFASFLGALFSGDFSQAFELLKTLFSNLWEGIKNNPLWTLGKELVTGLVNGILTMFDKLWQGVKASMEKMVEWVLNPLDTIKGAMNKATDLFKSLFGESIWPDWFQKLADITKEEWSSMSESVRGSLDVQMGQMNQYTGYLKTYVNNVEKQYATSVQTSRNYFGMDLEMSKLYEGLLQHNQSVFRNSYGRMAEAAEDAHSRVRKSLQGLRSDHEENLGAIEGELDEAVGHSWYPDLMGRFVAVASEVAIGTKDAFEAMRAGIEEELAAANEAIGGQIYRPGDGPIVDPTQGSGKKADGGKDKDTDPRRVRDLHDKQKDLNEEMESGGGVMQRFADQVRDLGKRAKEVATETFGATQNHAFEAVILRVVSDQANNTANSLNRLAEAIARVRSAALGVPATMSSVQVGGSGSSAFNQTINLEVSGTVGSSVDLARVFRDLKRVDSLDRNRR